MDLANELGTQKRGQNPRLGVRKAIGAGGFLCIFVFAGSGHVALAVDEFEDLIRIDRLPDTSREVESAFRRTRGNACEIVPEGEPLEISTFTTRLTIRDRRSRSLPIPASRRGLFSVGLEFLPRDRSDLPLLSRSQIVAYVVEHYVSIQGRVRRDLLDRQLYYHHRPIAVTAKYRGSRLSQAFESIISQTVQDFHGLGLFVAEDPIIEKPEHFRTMVMIFRTPMLRGAREIEQFEFVFVRGKETKRGESLDSHVFVTTDNRTKLHYLRGAGRPFRPSQATILGQIAVTSFDSSGVYPRRSAARSYRLDQRSIFTLRTLDDYCDSQAWHGGFGRNVDTVLDAIIGGRVESDGLDNGF